MKNFITLEEAKRISALPIKVTKKANNLTWDKVEVYIQDIDDNGNRFFDVQNYNTLIK